jgi:hypothetical protein
MHQVEGDLGGGVNISANLVMEIFTLFLPSVGNFKTSIFVFG